MWRSFAITPVAATLEVEKMTLPTSATIIDDGARSGGKYVKMGANGSISGTVSLPTKTTSLSVMAKGAKCKGRWGQVSMQIDGINALSATTISSTSWNGYSANTVLNSGTHTVNISASNISSCRAVYLDVVTFYGPAVITPVPTVSLNTSPASLTAGGSSTLTWNSTNTSSCTASGSWSGIKPTSGSASTGVLSTTGNYSLSCSGDGGTATATASVAVTAPTAPTTKSIYWGARMDSETYNSTSGDAPWSYATWDEFESHAGKKVSIVHYGQPPPWQQAWASGPANLTTSRGAIPLISMGTDQASLTDIANGAYDSSITAWADAVKAWGKPFFLRWDWEMNGGWFGWGAQAQQNPANFVAAWKHFHDVVASQGANNVTWVWCPNTLFTGGTPLNQLYPGDNYVDWTCMDGYNKASVGSIEYYPWSSFSQVFNPTYNQLLTIAPSKPIMIAETASNEDGGGSKAAWITDTLQTQLPVNYPKIKAFVWFNWPIYEGGAYQQWPIESSPSSQAAFQTGIQSPYYATNNYGNLPALTKVQPLP